VPELRKTSFNLGEVQEISLHLLAIFPRQGVGSETATVAAALTFGRLVGKVMMDNEDEVKMIQDFMDFAGAYFAKGDGN